MTNDGDPRKHAPRHVHAGSARILLLYASRLRLFRRGSSLEHGALTWEHRRGRGHKLFRSRLPGGHSSIQRGRHSGDGKRRGGQELLRHRHTREVACVLHAGATASFALMLGSMPRSISDEHDARYPSIRPFLPESFGSQDSAPPPLRASIGRRQGPQA